MNHGLRRGISDEEFSQIRKFESQEISDQGY